MSTSPQTTPTISVREHVLARITTATWLWTTLALICALAAFVATDRWFSIVDDETAIVDAARRPAMETIEIFWSGAGQHEHPPLSDLLLHFWLPVGGGAQWSLRLPSVAFYLAGLLLLALAAAKMAGDAAFRWLLAIGLLSPFGFHFARMAGWYSFCFFLVAAVTWAYLHYIQHPCRLSFWVFAAAALALVYSNYYGWVVLGFFVIDAYFTERKRQALKMVFTTLAVVTVAYTPLWIVFARKIAETAHHEGGPLLPKFLHSAFSFYTVFVSESVAPWFWLFSIPALCCIVISLVTAAILLTPERRRFLLYFVLLFGGLAALDLNTKRLLFISPWLFLCLALALSSTKTLPRRLLLGSLGCVAAIGWGGTIARTTYAAQHFSEPWAATADHAALALRDGTLVVSNSPSFLFDINYSLEHLHLIPASAIPGWVKYPRVIPTSRWGTDPLPAFSSVLLVKGTNIDWAPKTDEAEQWLRSHCSVVSEQKFVPETGRALKARFFKGVSQDEYRVVVTRFNCSAMGTGVAARALSRR